jgi:acetyl-CoA carboxylase carboxyl transferase subunit alpha
MRNFLDFEKPIAALEGRIEALKRGDGGDAETDWEELARLQARLEKMLGQTYAKLTPWQTIQVARHADRPHMIDYVHALIEEFTPLAGDRTFAEDRAVIGGLGRFRGRSCVIIGHEKGADTESRLYHNFGMARPEGYRKAQRLMRLGHRFGLPVITMVDTAGAYPGVDAEERGQAEAIAGSIQVCLEIEVPLITVILGEGGSGGAIALAAANTVMMLEHAIYSVISPEGCASILWRDGEPVQEAAEALKLTASDLLALGVIDTIIAEPLGGAHRDRPATITAVGEALENALETLAEISGPVLKATRREKFLAMGKNGLG